MVGDAGGAGGVDEPEADAAAFGAVVGFEAEGNGMEVYELPIE